MALNTLILERDTRYSEVGSSEFVMTGPPVSEKSLALYEQYLARVLSSSPNILETTVGCDTCEVEG